MLCSLWARNRLKISTRLGLKNGISIPLGKMHKSALDRSTHSFVLNSCCITARHILLCHERVTLLTFEPITYQLLA